MHQHELRSHCAIGRTRHQNYQQPVLRHLVWSCFGKIYIPYPLHSMCENRPSSLPQEPWSASEARKLSVSNSLKWLGTVGHGKTPELLPPYKGDLAEELGRGCWSHWRIGHWITLGTRESDLDPRSAFAYARFIASMMVCMQVNVFGPTEHPRAAMRKTCYAALATGIVSFSSMLCISKSFACSDRAPYK